MRWWRQVVILFALARAGMKRRELVVDWTRGDAVDAPPNVELAIEDGGGVRAGSLEREWMGPCRKAGEEIG